MLTLGHIRPTPEEAKRCPYFCTITLPKCHYRKGAIKQCEVMDKLLKRIGENYFEFAFGCYEITLKGNIHAHIICKLREGVQLRSNMASAKMMSSFLKSYSNCDFQCIKNLENILTYIYKDIEDTHNILQGQRDPVISLTQTPERVIKLRCKHGVRVHDECEQCKLYYDNINTYLDVMEYVMDHPLSFDASDRSDVSDSN